MADVLVYDEALTAFQKGGKLVEEGEFRATLMMRGGTANFQPVVRGEQDDVAFSHGVLGSLDPPASTREPRTSRV